MCKSFLREGIDPDSEIESKGTDTDNDSSFLEFRDLYSCKGLLGVGAFGVVLLVDNKRTKEKSALKIIHKDNLT